MVTREELEAGRSEKGGYNKAQLAKWGVPWPPPKGWKEALLAGQTMEDAGMQSAAASPIRPDMSAHDLLRKVVLAVIEKGHASDFYEFPDVLAYFGARLPPERKCMECGAEIVECMGFTHAGDYASMLKGHGSKMPREVCGHCILLPKYSPDLDQFRKPSP